MIKRINKLSSKHHAALVFYGVLFLGALTLISCTDEAGEAEVEQRDQQIQELQSKVDQLEKEIADKEGALTKLKEENTVLQNRAPDPHAVEKGDNHWEIAYNYLTEKEGVPQETAEKMLADAVLFHPILEGYRVWNYSGDQAYGGFLTQNEASISPGALERMEMKKMEEDRADLENEVAQLNEEMGKKRQELSATLAEMEALKQQAEDRRQILQKHISSLEEHIESLQEQYDELDSRLNSVYYLAGSKDGLEDKGKIEGSLFGGTGIGNVSSSDFQNRADLRESQVIDLKAEDLDVSRIDEVELLPERYQEGRDYRVEIAGDRRSAKVHLLNEDKFRLATVILCIG
jgi:septal ring factor EnvC (AmiA/AmiB activator)